MRFSISFILLLSLSLPVFPETNTTAMTDESTEGSATTYESTTEETADSTIETTTGIPACADGDEVTEECDCTDKMTESLDGICATPCDERYVWCEGGGNCISAESSYSCTCSPGYYLDDEQCVKGKLFGGEITFEEEYEKDDESWRKTTTANIEDILHSIYNESDGFKNAEVIDLREGSIIASYKLTYDRNTSSNVVQQTWDSKSNCLDETESTVTASDGTTYKINCIESNKTLIDDQVLCDYEYDNVCDKESTTCKSKDGDVWCECKDNYMSNSYSDTICQLLVCDSNADCNDPFGDCIAFTSRENNYCRCMWGFSGTHCKDPWLFTFTIVTAGLGLILVILVIVLICTSRKSKSHKKNQMPEDLNLKNPFVDFQPGLVRAKMPTSMNQAYDSLDLKEGVNGNGKRNSYTNGAYNHGLDDPYQRNPSTFQNDYQSASLHTPGRANDTDYF